MSTGKFDFVGIGYCSNDIFCFVPEIPLDSKVQILKHMIQGGGPAANSTVAAARLGLSAAFISPVGDDDDGKRILNDLEAEKVSTSAMKIRPGKTSAIAYCWIDAPTGKRSVAWTRGTAEELAADEADLELVRNARILHMDGHNPVAALAAAKEAKKHGVLVCIDAGTIRDGIDELLPLCDMIIASEAFARKYTGEEDLDKAIYKLADIGAKVTGITMGKLGSMILDNGKILRCPTFDINPVVDTTGAGDVYHTGFEVRYLETQDLMECMRFASAVSTLKCLKPGGRTGIPTRKEVEEFLATH